VPSSLSHVVTFTHDLDAVLAFVEEHARLGPVHRYEAEPQGLADLFGWPVAQAATRGALVGEGPGTLEIVEVPEALRDRVAPGLALLAVPHRDTASLAGALAAAGAAPHGPVTMAAPGGLQLRIVTAVAGGLPFELVEFGGGS
jgi:catechol 2,3-dioxygenase-like lactoylglutathione lyase family enzyme